MDESETDVAVLAERRAKLAKLRSEHFVADRDVTSAPHITSVDEYEARFGSVQQKTLSNKVNSPNLILKIIAKCKAIK